MPIKRPPVLIPFSQLTGADLETHQHYSRVTDDKGHRVYAQGDMRQAQRGALIK